MLERGREMVSFSYEHLVPIRHYVHQHPELSGQEYQTTAYLKAYLEKLGVRILNSGLKTGLIAEIGSGKPVIALRADIDASNSGEHGSRLPKSKPWCHACLWP